MRPLRIRRVFGYFGHMAEIPEKPPKKVRIHSITSFWWHAVKKSFRNAREPIGTIEGTLDLILGISAVAFITRRFSQERLDYMIYLFLAVPTIVCGAFFLWNLIKNPHKIYKEDLTAAISGSTPVFAKEITSRHFGRVFFITIIVSAFVALLSVKNLQIAELKSQLTSPKQVVPTKPLPVKIIPRPEPLPPPPTVPAQQVAVVQTQKQFDNFNTGTNDVEDAIAQLAKIKAENKAQKEAQEKATSEAANQWLTNALPYYNYALISLRDILIKEAAKRGDGIAQSVGYFQCLPSTISPEIMGRKLGEIGFQKDTNVVFFIEINGSDPVQNRLRIESSSGFMEININIFHGDMSRLIQIPNLDDYKGAPLGQAHSFIDEGLKSIIASQEGYLNPKK